MDPMLLESGKEQFSITIRSHFATRNMQLKEFGTIIHNLLLGSYFL